MPFKINQFINLAWIVVVFWLFFVFSLTTISTVWAQPLNLPQIDVSQEDNLINVSSSSPDLEPTSWGYVLTEVVPDCQDQQLQYNSFPANHSFPVNRQLDLDQILGEYRWVCFRVANQSNQFSYKKVRLFHSSEDCNLAAEPDVCRANEMINNVLNVMSGLTITIIVCVVIFNGIRYSAAGDNPEAIKAARSGLWNALIALICFIFLWAFLQWLIPGGQLN